jgi:hypothetical protein
MAELLHTPINHAKNYILCLFSWLVIKPTHCSRLPNQDALKEMALNLLQSGVNKAKIMKATGFSSRELELISH